MAKKDKKDSDGGASGKHRPDDPKDRNKSAPGGASIGGAAAPVDTGSSAEVTAHSPTPVQGLAGSPNDAPGSAAPVTAETPTPVEALTEPRGGYATPSTAPARREPATSGAESAAASSPGGGIGADDISDALLLPLRVARRVLPTQRAPVVIGMAALAVVGAVEWPVAVGLGLGWEALRRWRPVERPGRDRA